MTFDEVIENLYSSDDELICDMLNAGLHVSQCTEISDAVSTGFQCRSHKGTIFNVWYLISQRRVCWLKSLSYGRQIIGVPCKFDPDLRLNNYGGYYHTGFSRSKEDKGIWYDSYDVGTNRFNQIDVKKVTLNDDKHITSIISNNEVNISSFFLHNHMEMKSYPLFSEYVPVLFKSSCFSPMKDRVYNGGIDVSWNNYGKSCEKYNGYNGWSDDLIDDVFGGIPEATWNVD